MKKFPVLCPPGSIVMITQWFKPFNNPEHDAIDFIIRNPSLSNKDNDRLTYGAQLIQTNDATCMIVNNFGTMNPLGNGIDFEWQENGYWWRIHFWHTVYNYFNVGDKVKAGTVVALMGNTGDVNPKPTPLKPYDGTHCHMRYSRYQKNADGANYNIVSLDPTLYFDINNPYEGVDSSVVVDLQPVYWAWDKLGIKDNLSKLFYFFKNIFN